MTAPKSVLEALDFFESNSSQELISKLNTKGISCEKVFDVLAYEKQLRFLQIELVKLQQWVLKENKRVAVVFEGRDAAGKGGNIRRFMEHLNQRSSRLVALNKPTNVENTIVLFQHFLVYSMPPTSKILDLNVP